jgi:glycosyltransferase involved in cell wall biosynthesis
MKILQIINSLETGGAEKLMIETIPLFNKKNLKMDLLVLNGNHTPFFKALEQINCCKIFSLGNGSVYNPFLIFKIIPYLKKYDIIHVHIFPSLYWVAFAKIIAFSRTKLVYTEHSTSNNRRNNLVFKILDKFVYTFYSKIITIAPEVDANIKKHLNFDSDKFELIQNGINLESINNETFISRSEIHPNLKEDFKIIIQVASFRYPKDQKTVIKALKDLPEKVVLILVGEGPLKNECITLAKTIFVEHRVFFLGIRMDVIKLLKSSDIIVLSSHHEGLSLSCIEGMASGKPFIASDAPGLGNIVRDAGVLFPMNDTKSLAVQINKLLNNENHYNSTVKRCMERAKLYSINHTITKEINLYKKLIEQ